MINVEVCIDNFESLLNAENGGATRIELCGSLALGGLTPNIGLIKQVIKHANIPVYSMIRPREGDFLYSSHEVEIMLSDIHAARNLGVQGVVFGVLNNQSEIDADVLKDLMDSSKGLGVTFHRAIDCCLNVELAIDTILSAGCERVLTSGLANTAELGVNTIRKMVELSQERLSIMAGSGIDAYNVANIVKNTRVKEVHLSGKVTRQTHMQTIQNCGHLPEFMKVNVTDAKKVRDAKQALKQF